MPLLSFHSTRFYLQFCLYIGSSLPSGIFSFQVKYNISVNFCNSLPSYVTGFCKFINGSRHAQFSACYVETKEQPLRLSFYLLLDQPGPFGYVHAVFSTMEGVRLNLSFNLSGKMNAVVKLREVLSRNMWYVSPILQSVHSSLHS